MADRKISDLTALTAPAAGDYLPIVDISEVSAANKNKRITIEELLRGAPDGTAAAPSIGFESDPNTGIYSPGADALGLVTGGTDRLRITSAGLVGIGTSSPSSLMHLQTTSTNVVLQMLENNGSTVYGASIDAFNSSGGNIRLRLHDSGGAHQERLRITSTGNVGIGTTPVVDLDVAPAASTATFRIHARSNTTPVAAIELVRGTNTTFGADGSGDYRIKNDTGNLSFEYGDGGVTTERARIDSSGRLLVGTSTARANFYNSTLSALFQQEGAASSGDPASRFMSLTYGKGNNDSGVFVFAKHRATTVGGQTIVADGDSLGEVNFQGSDGTEFVQAASIRAAVDGTPGANDMPGRLVFSVTADGSASPTEALRISNNRAITVSDGGNVVLGTTTGTKIGTATTQKLGFYNATPVVQPAAVADATDAASVIARLNDLLAKLRTLGIIAT